MAELKDHYGNPVPEGWVPGKDAHGNTVYFHPDLGKGPAHAKATDAQGRARVDTGKTDAHGNKIYVDAE
jgi:hypothetical protein